MPGAAYYFCKKGEKATGITSVSGPVELLVGRPDRYRLLLVRIMVPVQTGGGSREYSQNRFPVSTKKSQGRIEAAGELL